MKDLLTRTTHRGKETSATSRLIGRMGRPAMNLHMSLQQMIL
jgi:hypothetical protein